ncbi:MAG: hypothetical protein GC181_10390 [Bacteroidetes bacterium]|nr:hypothetical protein [Bacteroidota bacterium]
MNLLKTLPTLILTISCNLTNAQDQFWHPVGTQWTYTCNEYIWPAETNILTIVDTATIMDKQVSVLIRNYTTCDLRPDTEYFYKHNDSLLYWEQEAKEFRVLYNFGAQPGDTFEFKTWKGINHDSSRIVVDSIGWFLFDTLKLKKYYVRLESWNHFSGNWYNGSHIIIEDIGCLSNLFLLAENGGCDVVQCTQLRCFTIPGKPTISFVNGECILDVRKIKAESIEIYPNPAVEKLSIRFPIDQTETIIIRNATGKVIKSVRSKDITDFESEEFCISVSDLSPGIYHLSLVLSNSYRLASAFFIVN